MAKFRKCALVWGLLLVVLPVLSRAQPSSPTGRQASSQSMPQPSPAAGNGRTSTTASDNRPPADSSAFALLDSLFRRPEFLYITIGPDIPADMQPLLIKFNNAIAANQAWFQEYLHRYPNQTLPYDEHFGITAEQYHRVLRLQAAPPPLVPIDSQTVAIVREGGFIHFQCSGKEHFLNYLYIDPTHRILEYGGDTIPFAGPASAGRNSPFGEWKGYAWHLERVQSLAPPEDPLQPIDPQKAPDPRLISARIVEVNIGVPTDGSPKTFIRIQYQNLQAGLTTANVELLGYIE